jgi:hypothetical protein
MVVDVGVGVVRLDPARHQMADGWRWKPGIEEWVSVQPTIHRPDGWPVHVLHVCRSTNEKEQTA